MSSSLNPSSEEFLHLLQKQDGVISELFGELEFCKNELKTLKSQSLASFNNSEQLCTNLRSAYSTLESYSNLDKNKILAEKTYAGLEIDSSCKNCIELKRNLVQNEERNEILLKNVTKLEQELSEMRKQELQSLNKVQEAVELAEEANQRRNEVQLRLDKMIKLNDNMQIDVTKMNEIHKSQIEETRNHSIELYKTELDTKTKKMESLLTELNSSKTELSSLKSTLMNVQSECDHLKNQQETQRFTLQKEIDEIRLLYDQTTIAKVESTRKVEELEMELSSCQILNEQKTTLCDEKCDQIGSLLNNTKSQYNECKIQLMTTLKVKGELQKEVITLRNELTNVRSNLDQYKSICENTIKQECDVILENENFSKKQLESLLETQNVIIYRLKHECHSLTEQIGLNHKQYNKEMKLLRNENEDLIKRLDQALS